ncbi:hypothetical protein T06_11971 [Trichinella sp. T6]|nr:hypothetical protein T06_11971 [Trichinella sp. T6]
MIGFLGEWTKKIVITLLYGDIKRLNNGTLYYSSGKPISRCEANPQDTRPGQNTFN